MLKRLGNYFLTGVIITLPIIVTVFLLLFLVRNIGAPVSKFALIPIFEHFGFDLPESGVGGVAFDFLSTIVVVVFVTILGLFSQFLFAKFLISLSERVINKIPFIGMVYRTVKQIVDTFAKQKKTVFQKVVLIEFPRKGTFSVGFITSQTEGEVAKKTDSDCVNVFVPTTPNPTSGFLMAVEKNSVKYLDMSVGDAMKFIISGGAVAANAENETPAKR